ncbi:MAG: alpha/beta fold hydrolase [Nocardioidaceae bacterium]
MVYDELDVPGSLHVGRWTGSPDAATVLAVHGVTGNHRSWSLVAERVSATFLAPDLRGRGLSGSLPGPVGIARHVADLVDVLDHLDLARVTLVGHSMGGFVVAALAAEHPDRVDRVVLVDGGLPFPPPPPGRSPEEALAATLGPAAQRLTMTFESREAYLDFWRPHPALGPHWSAAAEEYFDYDLVGEPPTLRSSVSLEAVGDDSRDMMDADTADARVHALPPGTVFLRAPYGMLGEPGGLYPAELVAAYAGRYPHVSIAEVPGVNHYTILLTEPGATAVATALPDPA